MSAFKDLSVSEMVTTATTLTFFLSLFYEKGFFYSINSDLYRLLTVSDFVASAVYWLPVPLILLFIGGIWNITIDRIEEWRSEQELVNSSSNPKVTSILRRSAEIFCFIVFPMLSILHFLFIDGSSYMSLLLPIAILSFIYIKWIWNHPNYPYGNKGLVFLSVFLILIPFSFINGLTDGRNAISEEKELGVRIGNKEYEVIRRLNYETIVFDKEHNTIKVFDNAKITSLEMPQRNLVQIGELCRHFGFLCR